MAWVIFIAGPLLFWTCVGLTACAIGSGRRFRRRDGAIPVRRRRGPGERWRRGHAVWVADVFAYRSSPFGSTETLDWVFSAALREATLTELVNGEPLEGEVVAVFTVPDGSFEVAAARSAAAALLGPFSPLGAESAGPAPSDDGSGLATPG